jgi:hypothetical protein
MKIVMDTGALVGTIAAPLDTEFGRMTTYKERGI